MHSMQFPMLHIAVHGRRARPTLELEEQLSLTSLSFPISTLSPILSVTDKGPIPFLTGIDHFRRSVTSQELRLADVGAGPFKWLIGLFGQVNDSVTTSARLSETL